MWAQTIKVLERKPPQMEEGKPLLNTGMELFTIVIEGVNLGTRGEEDIRTPWTNSETTIFHFICKPPSPFCPWHLYLRVRLSWNMTVGKMV